MSRSEIKEKILAIAQESLAEDGRIFEEKMTLEDMNVDSLDFMEFLFAVDDEFGTEIDADKLTEPDLNLGEILDRIASQIEAAN